MKRLYVAGLLACIALDASAALCFFKGERVSGMNKICFYDCLGSTTAINVKSYELCPLNINAKGPGGAVFARSSRPPACT